MFTNSNFNSNQFNKINDNLDEYFNQNDENNEPNQMRNYSFSNESIQNQLSFSNRSNYSDAQLSNIIFNEQNINSDQKLNTFSQLSYLNKTQTPNNINSNKISKLINNNSTDDFKNTKNIKNKIQNKHSKSQAFNTRKISQSDNQRNKNRNSLDLKSLPLYDDNIKKSNFENIRKKIIQQMSLGNKNNILKSDMQIRPEHLKDSDSKQIENINSLNFHSVIFTFNYVNLNNKLKTDMFCNISRKIYDDIFVAQVINQSKQNTKLFFVVDEQAMAYNFTIDQQKKETWYSLLINQTIDYKRFKKSFILRSDPFQIYWSQIILITVILQIIQMPVRIAIPFDNHILFQLFRVLDIFIFALQLQDIILHFFVIYEEDGKVLHNQSEIVIQYFKTQLFMDILALINIEIKLNDVGDNKLYQQYASIIPLQFIKIEQNYIDWKILSLVNIFLILKYLKQSYIIRKMIQNIQVKRPYFKIITNTIYLLFFVHIFSCIYISNIEFDMHTHESLNENWYTAYKKTDEYFQSNGIQDNKVDLFEAFLLSQYMALQTVTTVGQGDVPTTNRQEMVVKMFGMLIGVQFWSLVTASIISQSIEKGQNLDVDKSKLLLVNQILESQNLQTDNKYKLRKTLVKNSTWNVGSEKHFLDTYLKTNDKKLILSKINTFYQNNVQLFKNKTLTFLTDLMKDMKLVQFDRDETIEQFNYNQDVQKKELMDTVENSMMILMKGEVSCYDKNIDIYSFAEYGVYKLCEYGKCFNLAQLHYSDYQQFDKDYKIQESTEVLFINLYAQKKHLRLQYGPDQPYQQEQFLNDSLKSMKTYILNKLIVFFLMQRKKVFGEQLNSGDFHELECKLNLDQSTIMNMVDFMQPYWDNLNSTEWYYNLIDTNMYRQLLNASARFTSKLKNANIKNDEFMYQKKTSRINKQSSVKYRGSNGSDSVVINKITPLGSTNPEQDQNNDIKGQLEAQNKINKFIELRDLNK